MNKEANFHSCELIFDAIENHRLNAAISTIVVAEVLVGFYQSNNLDGKDKFLQKLKIYYEILPVSLEISEKGAEIRAQKGLKLPDALIYASSCASEADLLISSDHPLGRKSRMPVYTPEEFVKMYLITQDKKTD
jgi:predicted nucleic acid-binding protein